jgi:hypothetical protein
MLESHEEKWGIETRQKLAPGAYKSAKRSRSTSVIPREATLSETPLPSLSMSAFPSVTLMILRTSPLLEGIQPPFFLS